jgi:hypothetical protein
MLFLVVRRYSTNDRMAAIIPVNGPCDQIDQRMLHRGPTADIGAIYSTTSSATARIFACSGVGHHLANAAGGRLRSCLAPQAHRASDPCSESPITASVSAVSCTGGFGFFWYGCAAPGVMVGAIGGAAAAGVDDVSLEATTGPESCGVTDLTSTASPWSPGVSSQRFQNAACLVGHGSSPQARCKQRLHASARPPPT